MELRDILDVEYDGINLSDELKDANSRGGEKISVRELLSVSCSVTVDAYERSDRKLLFSFLYSYLRLELFDT